MSNKFENIFNRLSYVVDNYYGGNASEFCRDIDISRQHYSNWKNEYEEEGKEPNIGFHIMKRILKTVVDKTNVNPVWLLIGEGEKVLSSGELHLIEQSSNHKNEVDQLDDSGRSPDEIAEYLLKNRKAVLEFLRSLE